MKNLLILTVLSSVAIFGLSCNKSQNTANANRFAPQQVKRGVAPEADTEVALIEMEDPAYGTIKIELYPNIAPKAVERFKELAKEGYYEGIIFHRVNDSVIQAGNADTKPGATPSAGREGDSGKPNVPAEFSDIQYDTGIVGAARLGNDVNSANSQFFIMLKREAAFDNKYTVFGKVIDGMNNVRTIAGAPRQGEKPTQPIRIKKMTIIPREG